LGRGKLETNNNGGGEKGSRVASSLYAERREKRRT